MKNRTSLIVILLFYAMACGLPAFGDQNHPTYGILCLICLPWVLFIPAWWANPLFFAGCLALARGKATTAAVCGVFGSLLAGSFFFQTGLRNPDPQVGSGLWMVSMIGLAIVGFRARCDDL